MGGFNRRWGRCRCIALIRQKLPLPGVIGRICDHPCEEACLRGKLVEALDFRFVPSSVLWPIVSVNPENGMDCPSGVSPPGKRWPLSVQAQRAWPPPGELAICGHAVTIYEANPNPGGMLRYGIPAYRLPRDVLDSEIERILAMGVDLKTNVRVGKDIQLDQLRTDHAAVFLATGLHLSRSLPLDNIDAQGVLLGVDFLHRANASEKIQLGERVVCHRRWQRGCGCGHDRPGVWS